MKLSVSNIVWGKENFGDFLKILKNEGCDGVELAPSLIWDEPISSNKNERQELKKKISDSGLEFIGFHSLLFSKPELQLFKNEQSRKKTIEYINDLINVCSDLGGKNIVFGSPNNRSLNGKNYKICLSQSYDDFSRIAEYAKEKDIFFCIEPLGENYTDFITSFGEGGDLVKKIDHSNFRLHLDTKTIFHTKEDMEKIVHKYGQLIQHVHISDNDLCEPGTINMEHKTISESLKKINYKKYLSIEMKKSSIKSLISGIKFVKSTYIS